MIEVLRCGAFTSVQDLGRFGLRHLGVSQAGVLDPIATQQANLLLGNEPNAAVVELTVGPLQLAFHQDCSVVVTGVDFNTTISTGKASAQQQALLPGQPIALKAGMQITLQRPMIPGSRAYVAVSGGVDVPVVLGSRSTDINAGFGGFHGRVLQTGDVLPIGRFFTPPQRIPYGIRPLAPSHVLRALPGPDYDAFTADAHQRFWMQAWGISHQSNRMGLRLNGQSLKLTSPLSLLSAGVLPGDVQVPPDGLPIVLSNDAQTIGGYPRIASVIQADLWQLAHLPPLTSVYFQPVTHAVATQACERQSRYLERLTESLAGGD
jgi:biotin-dependent carboxylase-like uncharacterized protein